MNGNIQENLAGFVAERKVREDEIELESATK